MINETINKNYGKLSFIEAINIFPYKVMKIFNSLLKERGLSLYDRYGKEDVTSAERERLSFKEIRRETNSTSASSNPWTHGRANLSFTDKDKNIFSISMTDRNEDASKLVFNVFTENAAKNVTISSVGSVEVILNKVIDHALALKGIEGNDYYSNENNPMDAVSSVMKRLELLLKKTCLTFKESDYSGIHKVKVLRKNFGAMEDSGHYSYMLYISLNSSVLRAAFDIYKENTNKAPYEIQKHMAIIEISRNIDKIIDIIHQRDFRISRISFSKDESLSLEILKLDYNKKVDDGLFGQKTIRELEDKAIKEVMKKIKGEKIDPNTFRNLISGMFLTTSK